MHNNGCMRYILNHVLKDNLNIEISSNKTEVKRAQEIPSILSTLVFSHAEKNHYKTIYHILSLNDFWPSGLWVVVFLFILLFNLWTSYNNYIASIWKQMLLLKSKEARAPLSGPGAGCGKDKGGEKIKVLTRLLTFSFSLFLLLLPSECPRNPKGEDLPEQKHSTPRWNISEFS